MQPARRAIIGVVASLALLLALLLPVAIRPQAARAAGPIALPQGPVPIDEELAPIELSFMTIDATISANAGDVIIDTRTRTRLRNPDKKSSYQRQVTFPGQPVTRVRIGTQNSGLRAAEPSDPWTLDLGPDGDAIIEGIQRLTIAAPVVDLEVNWEHLGVWGRPLGAVRLTLHFPADLHPQQLLSIDPEPTERDTVSLTWSYEKPQPAGRVRVLFIAPQQWRPVASARLAASGPEATAADWLALAAALRPLVEAEGMPPAIAAAQEAELLAAVRQAVATGPQDARAHAELADYLRAHAGGDPALLSEAVAELQAAFDLAPGDATLKQKLLAGLDELMAACRRVGDTRGMLMALDIVESLAPQGSQERAAAYADLIVRLLEEGRVAEAEATIVAGFGQAELDRYAHLKPHFSLVAGEVETLIGRRTLRFTLVPHAAATEAAGRDLAALVEALGRIEGAQVQRQEVDGRAHLELTIPFASPEDLRVAGQTAAQAAEGVDPALRLLLAAAAPAEVSFQAVEELARDRLAYAESADLTPAQGALADRLEELASMQLLAEAEADGPLEAARQRWVAALARRYEADWQSLVGSCQVSYRLLPPEDIVAPHWTLAWGEQRSLSWSMSIPRYARLQPYVAAAIVLLLAALVGAGVWQWRRRARAARGAIVVE